MLQNYPIVAVEKLSSLQFAHIASELWSDDHVLMPVSAGQSTREYGIAVERTEANEPGGGWFGETFELSDSSIPAQISFTSGTTGSSKAVLISKAAVSATARRISEVMEMTDEIREYIGVPITFSFGLGRVRAVGSVGGQSYIPDNGFRLDQFAKMLQNDEVNAFSAVPTILRVVLQHEAMFAEYGSKLRWLEIGSQFMSKDEKLAIRKLFPNAKIAQHYGLTEASRSTFLRIDRAAASDLESVGSPLEDVDVAIGEDGRIRIRGPHVAEGYVVDGAVVPITDADGWLETSDLGNFEGGLLYFLGRADDVVNVGGIKVSPEILERQLSTVLTDNATEPAADFAVVGIADELRGEVIALCVDGEDPERYAVPLNQVLKGYGLGPADYKIVSVTDIPKTDTGKVKRNELASSLVLTTLATRPAPATATEEQTSATGEVRNGDEAEIAEIWKDVLGVRSVSRNDTFYDLGGDSLSAISVMLRMEKAGIPEDIAQQIFEGRTIAEIAAAKGGESVGQGPALQAITGNAINFTRGILVLLVIGAHWGPFVWQKAGSIGAAFAAWTWPLFRFGTPGFAMVFGLGLGYFWSPMALTNSERLKSRIKTSFVIVASGVAILAALRSAVLLLSDGFSSDQWPRTVFYDVLSFYLLAVLTIYPILTFVARSKKPVLTSLLLMVVSFGVAEMVRPLLDYEATGFLKLGLTLLSSNYGYPVMLGYTLIGLTAGLWIKASNDTVDLARTTALTGAVLFFGGIVLMFSVDMEAQWFVGLPTKPALFTYTGAMLLLFSASFQWQRTSSQNRNLLFRIMVLLGVLAFPAYVVHAAALPLRNLFELIGLPAIVAIAAPVVLALGIIAVAMSRIYRVYFPKRK